MPRPRPPTRRFAGCSTWCWRCPPRSSTDTKSPSPPGPAPCPGRGAHEGNHWSRAVPALMSSMSRRSFLTRGASLVAAGWAVPSFIAETARVFDSGAMAVPTAHAAGRKILVIIQLAGGNDGMNTLIPYANPAYAAARPTIAIPAAQVLQLDNSVGLHPSMTRLKARYDKGQMAVVQGVSYPNPNRSHFRGTDIWESAVPDRLEAKGWVGRYLEQCG